MRSKIEDGVRLGLCVVVISYQVRQCACISNRVNHIYHHAGFELMQRKGS